MDPIDAASRCDCAARDLRRWWIIGRPGFVRSRSGWADRWRSCARALAFALALLFVTPRVNPAAGEGRGSPAAGAPNSVVIFADDLGYADLGCYGASRIRTPHLDRMAREGLRFTSFCVGQAVCSASRAALLTGCYPNRIGILGALGPGSKTGIHADETTLAEVLKARGYATAVYGKWHLGDAPEFLPTRHGFDEYYGLPYSNDMWPKHPQNPQAYPPLPLIEGERVIQTMPDQNLLTEEYTRRAVDFIQRHRDRPFFLYLPLGDAAVGRVGKNLRASGQRAE